MRGLEEVISAGLRRQADSVVQGSKAIFVVLPATGKRDAGVVAKRIREMICDYLLKVGLNQKIAVAMGIASFPEDGETADALIESAHARVG